MAEQIDLIVAEISAGRATTQLIRDLVAAVKQVEEWHPRARVEFVACIGAGHAHDVRVNGAPLFENISWQESMFAVFSGDEKCLSVDGHYIVQTRTTLTFSSMRQSDPDGCTVWNKLGDDRRWRMTPQGVRAAFPESSEA